MKPVIFDTGPQVAWFCPRDEHNAWARETFKQIPAGGSSVKLSWLKSAIWSRKTASRAGKCSNLSNVAA